MKIYLLAAIASYLLLLSCSENSTNNANETEKQSLLPLSGGNYWIYVNNDDQQTMKIALEDLGQRVWGALENTDSTFSHQTYLLSYYLYEYSEYGYKKYSERYCINDNGRLIFGQDGYNQISPDYMAYSPNENDEMWIDKTDLKINNKEYKDCLRRRIEGSKYEWLKKGIGFVQLDKWGKRWMLDEYKLY